MDVTTQNNSDNYHATQTQISTGISYSFFYMLIGTSLCGLLNIAYFFKNNVLQQLYNSTKTLVVRLLGDQDQQQEEVLAIGNIQSDDPCGICQELLNLPVQFLCRHEICSRCFIQFWNSQNQSKLKCPLCRRTITIVLRKYEQLPNFIENDTSSAVSLEIKKYNLRHSNQNRSIIQMIRDMPFLIEQTIHFILTWDGFVYFIGRFLLNYRVLLLILYVLSPFDLIPEFIFGVFGLIDDLLVVSVLMVLFSNLYYTFLLRREQSQQI